jgi:chromosome partitioning protein
MGKIISVGNRKGGVGKTTVAYNLGFTYAVQGKKVLFIDLDTQCNLSLICNVDPVSLEEFKSATIKGVNIWIDILPGTKHFDSLKDEINREINRNTFLEKKILKGISDNYDYVIIDTPPALDILNINAFCFSDMVHIVINPDYFSLSGLAEMKNILEEVKGINSKLKYDIILNSYTGEKRLVNKEIDDLLKKEKAFSGVRIPTRQHVITETIKKRPAIENEEIKEQFDLLASAI